jgi:hypothetical protein
VFRDFLSCDPLLFSAHPVRGLPCCLDYVSIVVDVPKSGIYDLWAAVEAPYVLGCRAASWSRMLKFHAANRLSPHLARRTNKEDEEWDGAPEELDHR